MREVLYDPPLTFEWTEPSAGQALRLDLPKPPSGYETDQAFFYKLEDGRVVGYFNRCSHINVPMDFDDGHFLDQNGWIMCRLHGARYDLATGEAVIGPAQFGLTRILLELEGNQMKVLGWRKGS